MKIMAASEFKAKCLAVLDHVARTGERIVIVKRGKPVAQLGPTTQGIEAGFPQDRLRKLGGVVEVGDIVAPPLPAEAWHAVRGTGA